MEFIGKVQGFAQRPHARVERTMEKTIKQDLFEFENSKSERPVDLKLTLAIATAFEAFLLPEQARPLHLCDVFLQDIDIWDKSPGIPWKDIGYETKNDVRKDPEAVRKIRLFWHRVKVGDELSPPDCLAYAGSDLRVDEQKIGVVWGYPATITFGEAMFAIPLIKAYQKFGPIAYGYETALGGMEKITERFSTYKFFSGIYFKKFDKTMPPWLIRVAFNILLYNIDLVHYAEYGIMDARRTVRSWDFIVDYFINTTIRTPNGLRFRKNNGIASGSYFTQLVGSICNYILITWAYLDQFRCVPEDMLVLGEDSLAAGSKPLSLKDAQSLFDLVGMNINFEKSQITTELKTMKFLGYTIGNGVP